VVLLIEVRHDGDGHLVNRAYMMPNVPATRALQAFLMAAASLGEMADKLNAAVLKAGGVRRASSDTNWRSTS
jgi:hypothetical protein